MWWENGTELAIPTNGCMASEFDHLEVLGVHLEAMANGQEHLGDARCQPFHYGH